MTGYSGDTLAAMRSLVVNRVTRAVASLRAALRVQVVVEGEVLVVGRLAVAVSSPPMGL